MFDHTCRDTGCDNIRRDIFCDNASCSDNGILPDRDTAKNRHACSYRGTPLHEGRNDVPVGFRLKLTFPICGSRVLIVDKGDIVANKYIIFDGNAFADKGMTGDLDISSDPGIFLNLDECPNLGIVPNFTSIEVDEGEDLDIIAEFDVRRDALIEFQSLFPQPYRLIRVALQLANQLRDLLTVGILRQLRNLTSHPQRPISGLENFHNIQA